MFHDPSWADPTDLPLPSPALAWEYRTIDDPTDPDVRWSRWSALEPLQRGPAPRPDWVITSAGAHERDLGVLKTGKEADVHLLERFDPLEPARGTVMAAKRYRTPEHRSFHRAASYTEGRGVRRSRDQRALNRKSTFGRQVAAGEWAAAEWTMLNRCWTAGVPVPYPVQIDGLEILMEQVVASDGAPAPRLAAAGLSPADLWPLFEQLREALGTLAHLGLVHGDLSAYNTLAAGDPDGNLRLVLIDLPQMVDLIAHPLGADLMLRDCATMCTWFTTRGLAVDAEELFGEVMARAF